MVVITVGMRKGGNGKSTSALNLARCFSENGKRVLLIDLDEQKNASRGIPLKEEAAEGFDAVLLRDSDRGERALFCDAVSKTVWDGVDIITAQPNYSALARELDSEPGSHAVLKEALRECGGYDVCLIDTPPCLNILVINALCASDGLFIPLSSNYFSLQGLSQTVDTYQKIKGRLTPSLKLFGMAFVIHDGRTCLAREVRAKVGETYGEDLLQTVIGRNIKIEEAQAARRSIIDYAPGDRGAAQYRALTAELSARAGL